MERLKISYAREGEIPISRPPALPLFKLTWEALKPAGNPPPVSLGGKKMATPPDDAIFAAHAAVWRLHLPSGIDAARNLLLRVRYVGDIARFTLNGRLLYDDFYNGEPLDIGLKAFSPDVYNGSELLLHILPLRKDAPVYFSDPAARPNFGDKESVAVLHGIDVVESWTARPKV